VLIHIGTTNKAAAVLIESGRKNLDGEPGVSVIKYLIHSSYGAYLKKT